MGELRAPIPDPLPFGPSLYALVGQVSTFGLFSLTTFISGSHVLTIPRDSGPLPPDAGSRNIPSRFCCVPKDAGYFCLQGFTPHQRLQGDGFPDDACLDRVPVTENRVVSHRISVSLDDTTITTATCTTSCRTPTDELRRGAGYPLSLSFQTTLHDQIVPRYKAAKRRRLQRVLGGSL